MVKKRAEVLKTLGDWRFKTHLLEIDMNMQSWQDRINDWGRICLMQLEAPQYF